MVRKLLKGSCDLQVPGRLQSTAAQTKFLYYLRAVRSADSPNERCHNALLDSSHRVLTVVCSSCLQDACDDLINRRDGLLVAGLIDPDQLVTAVHVSHQDLTSLVIADLVLAADAGDGA